jgi:hypothetical protein
VVFVELKSDRGRLSVEQQDWLHALGDAGAECHVWDPRDWKSGHIEAILRKRAIGAEPQATELFNRNQQAIRDAVNR